MKKTFLAALIYLLALAGCGSSNEDPAPHSLCPSCGTNVGGQTSDFSGLFPSCEWKEIELTTESQASYETAAITAQLEAGMELPLFWSALGSYETWGGEKPDPYQAESESVIEATFTIGEFRRWDDIYPDRNPAEGVIDCGEKVDADVTALLSTGDGHLQAELHGKVSRTRSPYSPQSSWGVDLSADLDAVTGTIELPIDETRIHEGQLVASIGSNEGFKGTIEARIAYYRDEAEYEDDHEPYNDTPAGEHLTLLYGWFPEGATSP